ncbi:efflux RND transporter periplasmic adaptor subunit [uncultured Parvibaculum sp.]|uniref:HlyD family secretion protein n=1 Tax=uncultured Parvibaculum sp. TaxID=291828 RepID=UPI0030EDE972|tara:strand:+ start:26820 stop:27638 length:819 start_codon:yes stop_codon:yes gene_type:complete
MVRLHSLLFASVAALLLTGCDELPDGSWAGYAEGEYVRVGPIDGGRIETIAVDRGDRVEKGALLFRLDITAETAAEKQAAAQLAEARTTLDDTQRELKRMEALRAGGNVAQAALDTSRARRDRAGAQMLAAAAAHDQAKWRLARRAGHAPTAAIVQDVLFREGEFATASQPIVSLLPPENIKVRFFVPEAELGRLRIGDKLDFACSGCPADLTGTIRFVSTQAEFTPPVIYSEQSKEKLVYMVEAVPDADPEALHPGQPVTVRLTGGTLEGS